VTLLEIIPGRARDRYAIARAGPLSAAERRWFL
jgi:hypothetical protein